MFPSLGSAWQLGCIVPDLNAAIESWAKASSAAPFAVLPEARIDRIEQDGAIGSARLAVALGYCGATMIELLQPLGNEPNFYRDALAGSGYLHHFGYWPDDPDAAAAECEAHCWQLRARVYIHNRPPTRFYTFPPLPGLMIEVIEGGAEKRASYAPIQAQSGSWQPGDSAGYPYHSYLRPA